MKTAKVRACLLKIRNIVILTNTLSTSAVVVGEVSALAHEIYEMTKNEEEGRAFQ